MAKVTTMKFADGMGSVFVGQEVASDNAQLGSHNRLYISKVKTVGSKYVTLENGMKFDITTAQSNGGSPWGRLYSSPESYIQAKEQEKVIDEVRRTIAAFNFRPTYEQALKIQEILKAV